MTIERGAVRLQGVHKSFRAYHSDSLKDALIRLARRQPLLERRAVLHGVDLEVRPGERLGIVGKNGAGKSTLFRLMSRILMPDAGSIDVGGRVSPLIEVTAGFVPDLTGAENLRLNAALLGVPRRDIEQRFRRVVEFAGVGEFIETPVRYYSSGMQARLGFAIAVHVDADILLIDEVLAVGDAGFQQMCIAHLQKLADEGVTVVFVSHDLAEVGRFCERVVWLEDGVVKEAGAPHDVLPRFRASLTGA